MPHQEVRPVSSATGLRLLLKRMPTYTLAFMLIVGLLAMAAAVSFAAAEGDDVSHGALEQLTASWHKLQWVGFVSVEIGSRTVDGAGDRHTGAYFDWEAAGWGRTPSAPRSPLLSSATASPYRLTVGFDSRDKRQQSMLTDKSAFSYPVVGDSSVSVTEVESQGPVYVRVERGDSYLLYGDYRTDLNAGRLLVYDRRLTGSKLHYVADTDAGRWTATAMAARSAQVSATESLPSLGTVGYYHLSQENIVPGSERIHIVVLDAAGMPSGVLVRPLQRERDYTIDYLDGTLLFKQPVPLADAQGNAYQIIARYEYESDAASALTTAARLAYAADGWRLGVSYVNDSRGAVAGGNGRGAFAVDGEVRVAPWLTIETEWATSTTEAGGHTRDGAAYDVLLSGDVSPRLAYKLGHARQESGFAHLHGAGPEGTVDEGTYAQLVYRPEISRPDATLSTTGTYAVQSSTPEASGETGIASERAVLGATYTVDRWTWHSRLESGKYRQLGYGTDRWTSAGYRIGAAYALAPDHEIDVFRHGTTASSPVTGHTDGVGETGVGYSYRLNERTSFTAGFTAGDAGRQRLWAGVRRRLIEGNALTSDVYTRYQIDGTISEVRTATMIGLQNTWDVTDAVAIDFGYERTQGPSSSEPATGTRLPGFGAGDIGVPPTTTPPGTPPPSPAVDSVQEAWNAAFTFAPDSPYRFGLRYSAHTKGDKTRQFVQMDALGQLTPDVSVSARLSWSTPPGSSSLTNLGVRQRQTIGLAYRPVHSSRVNALAAYERDVSGRSAAGAGAPIHETHTMSAEASYWVTSTVELAGKIARRTLTTIVQPAPATGTNTNLYQMRGTVAFAPRWDATFIYRMLHLEPKALPGSTLQQAGYQASVGFALVEDDPRWRLEAGYRYADFAPEDDPSAEAFVEGPFARLTYRF